MNNGQQTTQDLSKALTGLVTQSQKVFETAQEQSIASFKALTKALEEVQEEGRQALESWVKYSGTRYQAVLDAPGNLSGSLENGRSFSDPNKFLENLFNQNRELYQELTKRLVSIQGAQVSLVKELVQPAVAVLESGQKLTSSLAQYGQAIVESYQDAINGFVATNSQVKPKTPVAR